MTVSGNVGGVKIVSKFIPLDMTHTNFVTFVTSRELSIGNKSIQAKHEQSITYFNQILLNTYV